MLALDTLKRHLRIDHAEEDALLQGYSAAAKAAFELWTSRKLIIPPDALPKAEDMKNELLLNDAIQQGALLLIGHWYAQREAVSEKLLHKIPFAVDSLWLPYKYWSF